MNYTYVIYITDKTNGTTDPNIAIEEKNEVDTSNKAIVFSQITFASSINLNCKKYSKSEFWTSKCDRINFVVIIP